MCFLTRLKSCLLVLMDSICFSQISPINLDGCTISQSRTVKNLDHSLSFEPHIKHLTQPAVFRPTTGPDTPHFLNQNQMQKSLRPPRIVYCNATPGYQIALLHTWFPRLMKPASFLNGDLFYDIKNIKKKNPTIELKSTFQKMPDEERLNETTDIK